MPSLHIKAKKIIHAAMVSLAVLGSASCDYYWKRSDGFDPDLTKSVVAVIPKWPGLPRARVGARDAPEGSAVAIMPGGYLVTNAHVLGRANKVDIRLYDGRLLAVSIIGRDPKTDLALLKAPIEFPVPPISKASSIGARVCAVGNQFGLGLSVTCGVVSALGRTNAGFNPIEDFVQTDASINPGGSGGALFDSDGRLIGIVSAIFTKNSDANIGVNFAADIDLVRRVVEDLKAFGRVKIGIPGFRTARLKPQDRRRWSGVRIVHVNIDGAAAAAGLRVGDIVKHADGRQIFRPSDLRAAIFLRRPGEKILVRYFRDTDEGQTLLKLAPVH